MTYDNQLLNGEMFLQVMEREREITIQSYISEFISNLRFLQALNGFLMILDCNGELFFATHSIETYLGFHQVKNRIFNIGCLL